MAILQGWHSEYQRKLGSKQALHNDVLYLCSDIVGWCLAEGYGNRRHYHLIGPCGSGGDVLILIRDGQAALPFWFPRSDVQMIVNYTVSQKKHPRRF